MIIFSSTGCLLVSNTHFTSALNYNNVLFCNDSMHESKIPIPSYFNYIDLNWHVKLCPEDKSIFYTGYNSNYFTSTITLVLQLISAGKPVKGCLIVYFKCDNMPHIVSKC